MDRDVLELIERDHREVKEHHEEATHRMWVFYYEPELSRYEDAPHDQQFKQAAAYIDLALEKVGAPGNEWEDHGISIEWLARRDWSRHMAVDLLYGVDLELIISAAHLKLDTENYLTHMAKTEGSTPHIDDSRISVAEDLGRDIPYDHLHEIEAVLDFAKLKRNNLAHFGFHYHGGPNFSELFVTVAGYLIDRYADSDDIPELERMAKFLDTLDQQRVERGVYPDLSIDFRPVS